MKDRYLIRGVHIFTGKFVTGLLSVSKSNVSKSDVYTIDNYQVYPNTVGQCTGRRDKNDKLIFEGDTVEDDFGAVLYVNFCEHFSQWRVYPISGAEHISKRVGAGIYDWLNPEPCLEVIGQIYDNPELMEMAGE